MDVSDPASALVGGLTMPLLRALAGRSTPVTAAQVHRLMGHGTEAGVRRAIERLADQGVVLREQAGDRTVYSLNRDHVLDRSIRALLRSADELPRRLRDHIATWSIQPVTALLYGSAARRDGDTSSDIDLLLVRPKLAGAAQRQAWSRQVDELRDRVHRWTGNHAQVTDRSSEAFRRLVAGRESIVDAWRQDGVLLAGRPVDELIRAA